MFKNKCKQCKAVLPKGAKEFCNEEHKQEWRTANLRPWQKGLINGIEKHCQKPTK